MPEAKKVTLVTVAAGVAPELFEHEFRKVMENMRDPNTDAKAKREIILRFVFHPVEAHGRRDEAAVQVKAETKLAGIKPARSFLFMGRENGEIVARTHDVRQEELLEEAEKEGKLAPIARTGA